MIVVGSGAMPIVDLKALSKARKMASLCDVPSAFAAAFYLLEFFREDSFLTGSRVYGAPKSDSDVDIVIFCPGYLAEWSTNDNRISAPFYVGKLNLIAQWERRYFDAWHRAMLRCWKKRPVNRDQAIAIHREEEKRCLSKSKAKSLSERWEPTGLCTPSP